MTLDQLIAPAIVAAIVSAVVTIVLRILEHRFQRDIERLKAQLAARAQAEGEATKLQLQKFNNLIGLIYRCRNAGRELVEGPLDATAIEKLRSVTRALEEELYAARPELEAKGLFLQVHGVKVASQNLITLSEDALVDKAFREHVPATYEVLDELHGAAIAALTPSRIVP